MQTHKTSALSVFIRVILILALLLYIAIVSIAQVKIGDNLHMLDSAAVLELESTTKALMVPRLSTAKRDSIISPAHSLLIYNTSQQCLNFWDSNANEWKPVGCQSVSIAQATANCTNAFISGTLYYGKFDSTVTITVPVTVTQVGAWSYQSMMNGIQFTGSGIFNSTGSQNITIKAIGIPNMAGTFLLSFSINNGPVCLLSYTISYGTSVGTSLCSQAIRNGTYIAGIALNATNTITLPVTVAAPGNYNITTNTVNGYSFSASGLAQSTGTQNITLAGTGTPTAAGLNTFTVTYGTNTCTFTNQAGVGAATVSALNCGTAVLNGTLKNGIAASGVTVSVPYTGGNGGFYPVFSVNSTGVTGLTATSAAGNTANGNSSRTFTITGTPSAAGTANFAINFGGKSCTLSLTVTSPPQPAPVLTFCTNPLSHTLRVGTFQIGANLVTVTAAGTATGQELFNPDLHSVLCQINSFTSIAKGTRIKPNQTIILTFSRPVTNIQLALSGMKSNESIAFTTDNGTPTLTKYGGSCQSYFTITGNTIKCNATSDRATYMNIGGVYFTKITLTANNMGDGGKVLYCYDTGTSL